MVNVHCLKIEARGTITSMSIWPLTLSTMCSLTPWVLSIPACLAIWLSRHKHMYLALLLLHHSCCEVIWSREELCTRRHFVSFWPWTSDSLKSMNANSVAQFLADLGHQPFLDRIEMKALLWCRWLERTVSSRSSSSMPIGVVSCHLAATLWTLPLRTIVPACRHLSKSLNVFAKLADWCCVFWASRLGRPKLYTRQHIIMDRFSDVGTVQ